jgi:chromatin remodeling complex protein RSC6
MAAKKGKKSARKAGKKPAKRKAAKKTAKKRVKKTARRPAKKAAKKKTKRKPNAAFMRPVQPDATLAAVVGSSAIPRTEITKRLWAYIKKNGLQDAKERRMINADANLKAVFGGKTKVSMFEMTKLVGKHVK